MLSRFTVAGPLAALMLVLVVPFFAWQAQIGERGLPVYIAQVHHSPYGQCWAAVLHISAKGPPMVNAEIETKEGLGERLKEVFSTRAQRVLFVKGDSDLAFGEVVRYIDMARGEGLPAALLTPGVEREMGAPGTGCLTIPNPR